MTSSNFRGKNEKTTFSIHICNLSPKVFTQILSRSTRWMQNLIPHPRGTHVAYFWWVLLHEKWEIHKKTWLQSHFLCISHFSCRRVHRKYATWVLLGWRIKFRIQRVPLLEIWVKIMGDKFKIRVEKVVLLFYYFLIFLLFYSKNGESSIMDDIIILNPIGCYKVYFCCTFFLWGPF